MSEALVGQLVGYALATVRIAGIVAPIWSSAFRTVPLPVVAAISFVLAIATVGSTDLALPGQPALVDLAALAIRQAIVGATIGFGVLLAFEAVRSGAHLIGLQSGGALGIAGDAGDEAPGIERLFGLLAAVLFFTVDGHHWLIAGIRRSFEVMPVAGPVAPVALAERFLAVAGSFWVTAFQIALPAIAALLLADIVLAALARSAPLLAGLSLSLQLRPTIALGALVLALPVLSSSIGQVLRSSIAQAFVVVR